MRRRSRTVLCLFFLSLVGVFLSGCFAPPVSVYCTQDRDCPPGYFCDLAESKLCLPDSTTTDSGFQDSSPKDQSNLDQSVAPGDRDFFDTTIADHAMAESAMDDVSTSDAQFSDTQSTDQVPMDLGAEDHGDAFVPPCLVENCPVSNNPCEQPACFENHCIQTAKVTGTACRDANISSSEGVCDNGQCIDACFLDNAIVATGTHQPGSPCYACQPNLTTREYSPLPDTTPCNSDSLWCTSQSCLDGDCILQANICQSIEQTPFCDDVNDRCVQCLAATDCPQDDTPCNGDAICDNGSCESSGNPCPAFAPSCSSNDIGYLCLCSPSSCNLLGPGYSCNDIGLCEKSLTIRLADSNQDGFQDPYTNSTVIGVGGGTIHPGYNFMSLYESNHPGALRYVLNIPQGAHITSARLSVNLDNASALVARASIYAEAVDNAAAMTGTVANELSNKSKTVQSATWQTIYTNTGWKQSADFSNVVQAIVNRPGWRAGNHLLLIIINTASLDFYAQEAANQGARLLVTYEIPAPH